MTMSITVHGGAGVIGGNKILLEANNTVNYDLWSQYFEEYLKPRATRGLADLFEIGLLPPLKGIYRSDLEPSWKDVWARLPAGSQIRDVHLDAILLSHAHLDHLRLALSILCVLSLMNLGTSNSSSRSSSRLLSSDIELSNLCLSSLSSPFSLAKSFLLMTTLSGHQVRRYFNITVLSVSKLKLLSKWRV